MSTQLEDHGKIAEEQAISVVSKQHKKHFRNIVQTALFAPAFYAIEWGLVGAAAVIISFLKHYELSELAIWLILWGLNLLFSGAVVLFNDRFNIDITLMEALRRLTNSTAKKSRLAGRLIEFAVFIRLILWDGPCQLLIYFRERLHSNILRGCFFVIAGGFQMFIWTKLYLLGYESVGDILNIFR